MAVSGKAITRRPTQELPGPSWLGKIREVIVTRSRRGPARTHGVTMDQHGKTAVIELWFTGIDRGRMIDPMLPDGARKPS